MTNTEAAAMFRAQIVADQATLDAIAAEYETPRYRSPEGEFTLAQFCDGNRDDELLPLWKTTLAALAIGESVILHFDPIVRVA